jgi:hypothetical protein
MQESITIASAEELFEYASKLLVLVKRAEAVERQTGRPQRIAVPPLRDSFIDLTDAA